MPRREKPCDLSAFVPASPAAIVWHIKSGEKVLPAVDADVIMEAEASLDGDFFVAGLKRR